MKRLFLLLGLAAVGCGGPTVPTAKYFAGQPVSHWLEEARSQDPKARKRAVEVLGNVGPADPAAIPALIAVLQDKDATVRDAAVLGLSKIGPDAAAALPAVRGLTDDKDPAVRKHARAAVGQIEGK
jgi:HEAT repeat protein